jgi:NADH:ubiquinone oxidoreductase subunit K
MIPVALAWLGVLASVLLVVALPLQLAGLLRGPVTQLMWIPMAAFEIPLGLWLIVKGVRTPEHA